MRFISSTMCLVFGHVFQRSGVIGARHSEMSACYRWLDNIRTLGQYKKATDQVGSGGRASDLYSESARYESRPRHRLSWLRFFVVLLSPSKNSKINPKFCPEILSHPFEVIRVYSYYPTIRKYVSAKGLGMFPLFASWNEFAETPMEAPLDWYIKRTAYRGYTRRKWLHKT
jgi:hypothetical protein